MAYNYFKTPFATGGDKTAIPQTSPPNGAVSYTTGFGPNYSKNIKTDPAALPVPRDQSNQLYYDITLALQQYQQIGVPEFITSAMNGGSAYSYAKYSYAYAGNNVYQSLVNTNTTDPAVNKTNWRLNDFSAQKLADDAAVFEGTVVDGNVVYYDAANSRYAKAVADGTAAQNLVGIADVTNKRVLVNGIIDLFSGLTPGAYYYLSAVTPGAITAVKPASNVVGLGIARSATQVALNIVNLKNLSSISFAVPGYIVTADGFIIQWGRITLPVSASSTTDISALFPIAFNTAVFAILTNYGNDPESTWQEFTTFAPLADRTLSGFLLAGGTTQTSIHVDIPVQTDYIAIGI